MAQRDNRRIRILDMHSRPAGPMGRCPVQPSTPLGPDQVNVNNKKKLIKSLGNEGIELDSRLVHGRSNGASLVRRPEGEDSMDERSVTSATTGDGMRFVKSMVRVASDSPSWFHWRSSSRIIERETQQRRTDSTYLWHTRIVNDVLKHSGVFSRRYQLCDQASCTSSARISGRSQESLSNIVP
jgi:hypothetical protein